MRLYVSRPSTVNAEFFSENTLSTRNTFIAIWRHLWRSHSGALRLLVLPAEGVELFAAEDWAMRAARAPNIATMDCLRDFHSSSGPINWVQNGCDTEFRIFNRIRERHRFLLYAILMLFWNVFPL